MATPLEQESLAHLANLVCNFSFGAAGDVAAAYYDTAEALGFLVEAVEPPPQCHRRTSPCSPVVGQTVARSRVAFASVYILTRFVVDCETLLGIAAGEIEVAAEHKLVAPTLVRSQALAALYEAARRGEISAAEGIERVTRINSLKVRFLGDKVLQRQAWKVAEQLGWETTYDAEYVALTKLQADAFVTSDADLARAVSGLVETATVDALRTA
jgi:indolepyruvate ferredoxin oxidoreductase alpha subunit